MSLLKSLLNTIDPAHARERDLAEYEKQKRLSQSLDKAKRLKLAHSAATQAEILYFLAEHDKDILVRSAVAANHSTPYQANRLIVKDESPDVRLALAGRLVRLLPDLSEDRHSQIYAYTIEALQTLARDEATKVRAALSQTLKDQLGAPADIINQLARDIERDVAEPILRHCAALSDEILLDIVRTHPENWPLDAVAGRAHVSVELSDAIIEASQERAGQILIENKTAQISDGTLHKIIEKARTFVSWQRPLAIRPVLPLEFAMKLADIADQSIQMLLIQRTDLDMHARDEITTQIRRRLDMAGNSDGPVLSVEERVKKLIAEKSLDEDKVTEGLNSHDREFVTVALAAMVRTSRSNMEHIISMQKPKAIIAICNRAGVSMRVCLRVQQEIARIPSNELIYPRGGMDYPMEHDEIKWQLEFLGLPA